MTNEKDNSMSDTDTDTDAIDTTILEWHAKGVGPGAIGNVLEALGLGNTKPGTTK